MALTFTLVDQGPNHVTYLVDSGVTSASPETGTIQPTGAGSANIPLQTAAPSGLIKELVLTAVTTNAQAQRLMQGNMIGAIGTGSPNITNVQGKHCRISLTPLQKLSGGLDIFGEWYARAVNVGGFAGITVELYTNGGAVGQSIQATALLYIEAVGTPQRA